MTIQTIFDRAMLLDDELGLEASGADVTQGLVAVNMLQDWFEAVAATYPNVLTTHSTFTTTANTETTAFPTGLLRVDEDFWLMDTASSPNLPSSQLSKVDRVGGHRDQSGWPLSVTVTAQVNTGVPSEYSYTGPGGYIYWGPVPDAQYTLRAYGLWAKADYSAAANTFLYPDSVAVLFPSFLSKMFRTGLDRDLETIRLAAQESFRPVLESLAGFDRTGAPSRRYSEYHTE